MKGKKATAYDGGNRVPCIIRYPNGGINTERQINTLTAHIDIMPTLLELCGVKYSGKHPLAGKSMTNLINKNNEAGFEGRILVSDSHIAGIPPKWTMSTVMQDNWRLVYGKELYDVSKDVGQNNNIAEAYPEKLKELRDFYDKWYDDMYKGENAKVNPIFIYKNELNLLDAHYMQPFNTKYPAWSQGMIKSGYQNTGTWDIEILEDGEYTFELRRYPREFDKPITYGGGKALKALPINYANLTIDGKQVGESSVDDKQHYVQFEVNLKKGRHIVESLFKGEKKLEFSTYYIYIF
ncbi:MAG: sulfatase-like hydrolase/transferase [Opitutales bacterium]